MLHQQRLVLKKKGMAGNRTELVLSLVSKAISDMETGMANSCSNIDEALLSRVNDNQNRLEKKQRDRGGGVSLENLRKNTSPLLESIDKAAKKRYAELVDLNVQAHFGYACAALRKLLDGLKDVVIDNRAGKKAASPVLVNRPHALGGIKPPNPGTVVEGIRKKMEEVGVTEPPSASTIHAAINAICMETDAFKRENAINNAFDIQSVYFDIEDGAQVVRLTGEMWRSLIARVLAEDWEGVGAETIMSSNVEHRPAEFGVGWRPEEGWSFPVENLWGDNAVSLETLASLLTRSIIPGIELSNFLLCMCTHLRCVVRSVKEILFDGDKSAHFENDILADWGAWRHLYNKLEWFMMVSRFFIFIHSRKDKFAENDEEECVSSTLARVAESIPPWLLVDEWVYENLMTWPPLHDGIDEEISIDLMLSLALRISPGGRHPVFGFTNNEERPLTHRINIESAAFCVKILLGRALDEEDHGIKMLVMSPPPPPSSPERATDDDPPYQLGVLPAELGDGSLTCPFLSNPTYCVRRIWNLENCTPSNAQFKRENQAIVANVMATMSPLLFPSSKAEDIGKEWASLRIINCCQAPAVIKHTWEQFIGRPLSEAVQQIVSKTEKNAVATAAGICQKRKTLKKRREQASTDIKRFTRDATDQINTANVACSLNAEHALWSTAVWKNTTSFVLMQLASFPDHQNYNNRRLC